MLQGILPFNSIVLRLLFNVFYLAYSIYIELSKDQGKSLSDSLSKQYVLSMQ